MHKRYYLKPSEIEYTPKVDTLQVEPGIYAAPKVRCMDCKNVLFWCVCEERKANKAKAFAIKATETTTFTTVKNETNDVPKRKMIQTSQVPRTLFAATMPETMKTMGIERIYPSKRFESIFEEIMKDEDKVYQRKRQYIDEEKVNIGVKSAVMELGKKTGEHKLKRFKASDEKLNVGKMKGFTKEKELRCDHCHLLEHTGPCIDEACEGCKFPKMACILSTSLCKGPPKRVKKTVSYIDNE